MQSLSRPPEITVKIARIFLGEHAWVPGCDGFSHTINNYPMEGTIQNGTIFLGGLWLAGLVSPIVFLKYSVYSSSKRRQSFFHKLVVDFQGNRLIHLKLNGGLHPGRSCKLLLELLKIFRFRGLFSGSCWRFFWN